MKGNYVVWGLVIVGLSLAGCSSSSSSNTTTTTSTTGVAKGIVGTAKWASTNGAVLTMLGSDIGSVASALPAAVSSHTLTTVSGACQKLTSDISQAKATAPIPNSTVQKTWSSLLTELTKAARDCSNGVNQNSTDLLDQASTGVMGANSTLNSLKQALGL